MEALRQSKMMKEWPEAEGKLRLDTLKNCYCL